MPYLFILCKGLSPFSEVLVFCMILLALFIQWLALWPWTHHLSSLSFLSRMTKRRETLIHSRKIWLGPKTSSDWKDNRRTKSELSFVQFQLWAYTANHLEMQLLSLCASRLPTCVFWMDDAPSMFFLGPNHLLNFLSIWLRVPLKNIIQDQFKWSPSEGIKRNLWF